jgi:hypothetical protein
VIEPDNSGSLELQTNSGTTALTIDTSQRAAFVAGTAAAPAITTTGDTNTGMWFPAADTIAFAEGGAESMRIDSSGNLLVGTTTAGAGAGFSTKLAVESNAIDPSIFKWNGGATDAFAIRAWNNATSGNNAFVGFATETSYTGRGSIDYNRGAGQVRYNTTSDATLKNIIGDSDTQKSVEILGSTRIREYTWKSDLEQKLQIGVIAQELYQTYKGAVSEGGKDANGNYKPWGVDKTAFTFHLIAGWQAHEKLIQEQQTIINDLKARVETLEGAKLG